MFDLRFIRFIATFLLTITVGFVASACNLILLANIALVLIIVQVVLIMWASVYLNIRR